MNEWMNEWQDSSDTSLVEWSIDRFTTKGKSGYLLQQYPSHVNRAQKSIFMQWLTVSPLPIC